jgi:hypothetical protein
LVELDQSVAAVVRRTNPVSEARKHGGLLGVVSERRCVDPTAPTSFDAEVLNLNQTSQS